MSNEVSFPSGDSPSLYRSICAAIRSDGTLPGGFSLPRPPKGDDSRGLRFADGAFDGIALYHMAPDKRDIKSLTEILGLIGAGSFEQAAECLRLFFSTDDYISMLPLIEDLQNWIIDHRDQIDANALYRFCLEQLKESRDVESMKFALSCLELLNTGENDQVRNLVQVLALSDEFTLYCLFIMRTWPDANEVIFETAKHVSGWGRIHAVAQLSPETEEIRRWMLLEGWHNTVMNEYSALLCAERTELLPHLQDGTLDEEEFAAAGAMLPFLLSEGPVAGLDALEGGPCALLERYLTQAEQRGSADPDALRAIETFCTGAENPTGDLIQRAKALLGKDAQP